MTKEPAEVVDRLVTDPPLDPEETRRRADLHACDFCGYRGWTVGRNYEMEPQLEVCGCMHYLEDDARVYQEDVELLPEAQGALSRALARQARNEELGSIFRAHHRDEV